MTMSPDPLAAPSASVHASGLARGAYRFRQNRLAVLGLAIVAILLALSVAAPFIVPYPDHLSGAMNASQRFEPPSAQHWFGTNEVGQDVFSLVLAGAQVSLLCGIAVVLLAAVVGVAVGIVAGYFGRVVNEGLMRVTDLVLTVPPLILAMAISAALGPSLINMTVALAASWWPGFARLARGEVVAKKQELYVLAAKAQGAGTMRILVRHILPNITSPLVVKMSLDVGFALLAVASLGFIGIGVRPPTPEWGVMLSVARSNMPQYWWTAIFPGLAICLAVFGFNLLGTGLRDVLDPKGKR